MPFLARNARAKKRLLKIRCAEGREKNQSSHRITNL
jgi:hypothetical protein